MLKTLFISDVLLVNSSEPATADAVSNYARLVLMRHSHHSVSPLDVLLTCAEAGLASNTGRSMPTMTPEAAGMVSHLMKVIIYDTSQILSQITLMIICLFGVSIYGQRFFLSMCRSCELDVSP